MTALRSREIEPVQTPLKTLKTKGDSEPCTPAKTNEPSIENMSSPVTNSSLSPDPNQNDLGLGSDSASVGGTLRRRSLRLASKPSPNEGSSKISVSGGSRKRKSVAGEKSNEAVLENVKRRYEEKFGEVVSVEDRVRDLRGDKFSVFEVKEDEKSEDEENAFTSMGESVLRSGLESSGLKNEDNAIATKIKGKKRKLKIDIGLSSLEDEDTEDKGFLNLRSGKRVTMRRIDEREVGCENKERGRIFWDLSELEEDPSGSLNVCLKTRRRLSNGEKGKGKFVEDCVLMNEDVLVKTDFGTEKAENDANDTIKAGKRFSREEKGKGKVVKNDFLLGADDKVVSDFESAANNLIKNAVLDSTNLRDNVELRAETQVLETSLAVNDSKGRDYMEKFKDTAKKNASRFAHFSSHEEDEIGPSTQTEEEMPSQETNQEVEDWPGPFSTAMKIINDRAMKLNVQQQIPCSEKVKPAGVLWVPRNSQDHKCSNRFPPSLQDLCMEILVNNAYAIASLDNVPDVLRHKLSQLLCDSRRMNSHIFTLLLRGSPSEVRIRDCSWLTEEEFTKSFELCDTTNLMVLQLDQSGRCMPDYVLLNTIARSLNSLPALTTISLKGACRLSDVGLSALVSSAPALRSINLSQCSLLTSTGIDTLADKLGSILRELYIDDCESIDAMLVLPALKKLEHLEVLSLTGIQSVSDKFIRGLMLVRGHSIKELILTDCVKLTDSSLKVIAENCAGLCTLDLVNLRKLRDAVLGYLANGCREIQTLKLSRNAFSDEAIAAYLETSGESLTELSLNNVLKVGHNTALSLARRARRLQTLDLSWCRNMTDEALGLIVDSCLSLRVLKLFGCTQVSNVFLDGHSNPHVKIIGLKMTPILENLKVPNPQEGPLHYSSVILQSEDVSI